jgi:hypothetical protein
LCLSDRVKSVLSQKTDPAPPVKLTQEQVKILINQTAEKYIENNKTEKDYTYVQRQRQASQNKTSGPE